MVAASGSGGSQSQSLREAIALIGAAPSVVRALFDAVPASALEPSGPDAWGARQVLEHLIDVEGIAFRDRIGRITAEENPFIRSIDPPGRLAAGGYAGEPLSALLERFEALRLESVDWLRSLAESDLARTGTHDVAGTIGAGELVHYWAVHDATHLRQLFAALRERLLPEIGNMTAFLEE